MLSLFVYCIKYMASQCNQKNEIHFFKILLERCLQVLRVPRKFTERYGFNLSNPVFFKPPDGTEWKIYWTKHEDDIYLQIGWKEFVQHYSLEKGHLVMFKYVETSLFHVLLFDKTTLQIEYPSHAPYHEKSKLEDKFSDDSVEILDENPPHLNTKRKSPSSSTRPQKKQKIGTHGDFEQMPSLKTEKELEEEMGGNAFTKKIYRNYKQKTKMRRLTDAEKTEILKRMKTFRSKNPFFTVIIQPAYVSNKSPLNIPSKFADEHIKEKKGTMILEVLEGRTWSVVYNGSKITSGWSKFARDNNLKVGDACAFDMKNSIELTFKVLIYRASEETSCSFSQERKDHPTSEENLKPEPPMRKQNTVETEAHAKDTSSEFRNPFFKIVMQNSHVSPRLELTVPLGFAKKYFNVEKNTIGKNTMLVKLQRIDGKSWSVKCKSRICDGKPRLEFHHGWKQFAVDNDLRIGDVCVFELIHRIKLVFDVTIFRDTNGGAQSIYSAQGSKVGLQESNRKKDIQRKNVCASKVKSANTKSCDQFRSQVKFGGICNQRAKPALEKTENFESNNPFFRVCIRPCHMQSSKPRVPTTYYLRCTTERQKNILIQVGERSWHVKLICYPHLSSAYFSAGWPAFARENHLRGGDVCIFELTNREVLKAHIFRCHS